MEYWNMGKIKKAGGLSIGDFFWHEGIRFKVDSFPTRTSVTGSNYNTKSGEAASCKISIAEIKTAPPLSEKERASFNEFIDQLMKDPYLTTGDIKQKIKYWCRFLWMDPKRVVKIMSKVTGLSVHEIMNSSKRDIAEIRFCCTYYFWIKGATQQDIADFFGKGNRCTIVHSIRQFSDRMSIGDKKLTKIYNAFIEELGKNC